MTERMRQLVAPAYLLLCLLIGGSVRGEWGNMLLRLIAIAIIAWAAIEPRSDRPSPQERHLQALILLALAWIALQLVPLPPALWTALPGREFVVDGYGLLGESLPWLPIALSPHDALATVLAVLPAIAMLAAMLRLRAYTPSGLAIALLAGTLGGVLLGALQVASADPMTSPWYLYEVTNYGVATGFFANANHMATLLVAAIPFLAALLATSRGGADAVQRYSAAVAMVGGSLVIILVGIVLNGSLAALGLGLPVLFASLLLVFRRKNRPLGLPLIGLALLLVAGVAAISTAPVQSRFAGPEAQASVESRKERFSTTAQIAGDFAPVGSGLGSFSDAYKLYENPGEVTRTYVTHAHNDYLEIAAELGVPGVLLLLLFLAWWARAAVSPWRTASTDAYARAATIASAAILAHSFVDFPLRTAAISSLFAACIVLMVRPWVSSTGKSASDLWPTRHLSVK